MQTAFSGFCFLALGLLLFSDCASAPKGDPVRIGDPEQTTAVTGQLYVVDTSLSRIHFVGSGVGQQHGGAFRLSSGSLGAHDRQITGGAFLIAIRSLELDEKKAMVQEKLRPHLLSADFFDAEKFGTASFEITRITPYIASGADTSIVQGANFSVSGNLRLKEKTRNVTFPAKVEFHGDMLRASALLNIDRTQWDMNYQSDKSLKDKFISETVNIRLEVVAKKK